MERERAMRKKAVIVLDMLIFESLNNADLFKHLNEDYFLCLWTSNFYKRTIEKIPYDGFINGLRNGCKPYKYLRMYLRTYHKEVLGLPAIIVDFEKNFVNSLYGYDMCVDIKSVVTQQLFNTRNIDVINTKKLFCDIADYVNQYAINMPTIISEESILSKSIVLSSGDIFEQVQKNKQKIINKKCVLVVGSSFFSVYHNSDCSKFTEFLRSCFIVVWSDNKNVNKLEINSFRTTMKNDDNINIGGMLFGLDRGTKSISFVRKHLHPTTLPFILVDNLANIYNADNTYDSFCDFDYYVNMEEFLVNSTFYNMERIIENIRRFIASLFQKPQDKVRIVEYNGDNSSGSDEETIYNMPIHYNSAQIDDEGISLATKEKRRKKNKNF